MASPLLSALAMHPAGPRTVVIVSDNPDTIHGLEGYLRNVGMPARSRQVPEVADLVAATTRAIVLFPDDFSEASVTAALDALVTQSDILKMIVTSKPTPYEARLADQKSFVVVTRPVWGWVIVDAIRAHEAQDT